VTPEKIGQIIREMREMFDFVLINTGSNLSPTNLKALDLSGTILLVTLPHLAAVAHAKRTLSVFTTLGHEKKTRLIVNRYNPAEDDMSPEEIGKTAGVPVLKSLPSDYRPVIHAINRGLSLWESAPRSPVTRAMFNLAETLCGGKTAPSRRKPGKKGVFRLWRKTPEKLFSKMSRKGDLTPGPGEAPCELPS
jgi:pilus assembly protein CpaE